MSTMPAWLPNVATSLFTFWNIYYLLEYLIEFLKWTIFRHRKTCITTRTKNSYWYIDFDKMAIVVQSLYFCPCGYCKSCNKILGLLKIRDFQSLETSTFKKGRIYGHAIKHGIRFSQIIKSFLEKDANKSCLFIIPWKRCE